MLNKYQGCLMGALIGDCFGVPFENRWTGSPSVHEVQGFIRCRLKEPTSKQSVLPYSDDTSMTHAVAESLIALNKFDPKHLAMKFTSKYYEEPSKQKYYANVSTVFESWKQSNFADDIFAPARARFQGLGSIGNGGGMRVAPVVLFCGSDYSSLIKIAKASTQLTHSNVLGYNGAILQSYALHLALFHGPISSIQLIEKLIFFCNEELEKSEKEHKYTEKLQDILDLLNSDESKSRNVVNKLGNSVKALDSIPTAIFCAMRSLTPIPEVETENILERVIIYAISMGGDTDTIASMAAAIVGAMIGLAEIPLPLQAACEASNKTLALAEQLFNLNSRNRGKDYE